MRDFVIEKVKKTDIKDNFIVLAQSASELDSIGFSKEELAYVKRKTSENVNPVIVNRLETHILVYIFSNNAPDAYLSMEEYRRAGNNIIPKLAENKQNIAKLLDLQTNGAYVLSFIEGLALGAYVFDKYKKADYKLSKIQLCSEHISSGDLEELGHIVDAVYQCRDWVNEPASTLTVSKFREEIQRTAIDSKLKTDFFDELKIASLKMGGLIAVNKGSEEPPFFAVLEWKPTNAVNKKPFILVGKGVVYDTGGYSLKNNENMVSMKCDMSGAAVAVSTINLLARNNIAIHVIALIPVTDNRVNEKAQVPGDIITMHNGTTVEVLNTDAEGRLILADALCYASKYKPELVIDLATLTGAAHAAIGKFGMVMAGKKHHEYVSEIIQSGMNSYERSVEFPMWDEYDDSIKSKIADIKNTGNKHAGAIAAAKFLERFTDYPWMHFDMAGPAFYDAPWNYHTAGGTGFGIRMLYDFFKRMSKK